MPRRNAADDALAAPLCSKVSRCSAWGDADRCAWRRPTTTCFFWRTSAQLPPRLLLLDTPDIDSDAQVNWQRADIVRQTADVLIAVLTQQKYNDAAVKQFFRHAAAADKAVDRRLQSGRSRARSRRLAAVARRLLPRDGRQAGAAYVVPYDRAGAAARGLTFYAVGVDGRSFVEQPIDLRRELRELRYDELKTRTLARRVAAGRRTATPASNRYFREVREASRRFAAARHAMAEAHRVTTAWPGLPASVLVDEIQRWWDERRGAWSRTIHGFYRTVGQAVLKPVKSALERPERSADPLAEFRSRERAVIIEGVSRLLDELDRLAEVGNDMLRPRLKALLGGSGTGRNAPPHRSGLRTIAAGRRRVSRHIERRAGKARRATIREPRRRCARSTRPRRSPGRRSRCRWR